MTEPKPGTRWVDKNDVVWDCDGVEAGRVLLSRKLNRKPKREADYVADITLHFPLPLEMFRERMLPAE